MYICHKYLYLHCVSGGAVSVDGNAVEAMYIYIYIYIYVCVCVYIYIYIIHIYAYMV